jgi:methylase of polypeptide subunit release factors
MKTNRIIHGDAIAELTNILRVPSLKGSSKEKAGHPSQKPEKLIEHLIVSSSRPSDLVLDSCLGSGTMAMVAERLECRWIGIEHNVDYIRIAEERLRLQREQKETPLFKAISSWKCALVKRLSGLLFLRKVEGHQIDKVLFCKAFLKCFERQTALQTTL